MRIFIMPHNGGHMSSGGFRSDSLSTEAETTIEVLRLATHRAAITYMPCCAQKFLYLDTYQIYI